MELGCGETKFCVCVCVVVVGGGGGEGGGEGGGGGGGGGGGRGGGVVVRLGVVGCVCVGGRVWTCIFLCAKQNSGPCG